MRAAIIYELKCLANIAALFLPIFGTLLLLPFLMSSKPPLNLAILIYTPYFAWLIFCLIFVKKRFNSSAEGRQLERQEMYALLPLSRTKQGILRATKAVFMCVAAILFFFLVRVDFLFLRLAIAVPIAALFFDLAADISWILVHWVKGLLACAALLAIFYLNVDFAANWPIFYLPLVILAYAASLYTYNLRRKISDKFPGAEIEPLF